MSDLACSNDVLSLLCTVESPLWLTAMLDFRLQPLMIPYFCSSRISCSETSKPSPECLLPELILM